MFINKAYLEKEEVKKKKKFLEQTRAERNFHLHLDFLEEKSIDHKIRFGTWQKPTFDRVIKSRNEFFLNFFTFPLDFLFFDFFFFWGERAWKTASYLAPTINWFR